MSESRVVSTRVSGTLRQQLYDHVDADPGALLRVAVIAFLYDVGPDIGVPHEALRDDVVTALRYRYPDVVEERLAHLAEQLNIDGKGRRARSRAPRTLDRTPLASEDADQSDPPAAHGDALANEGYEFE